MNDKISDDLVNLDSIKKPPSNPNMRCFLSFLFVVDHTLLLKNCQDKSPVQNAMNRCPKIIYRLGRLIGDSIVPI